MSQMTALGADWWNDSGVPDELGEAVALGATGGTSNPVIVSQAVKAHPDKCYPIIDRLITKHPTATEDELVWHFIHILAQESAGKLRPVYNATKGEKGFLSVQVNPKYYRSCNLMVEQAVRLASLAPNIAIKVPAIPSGLEAIEEMTARGLRVNATVSFSTAQVLAVGEAIERGMGRARVDDTAPVVTQSYITLMVGRVDDHLKRVAEAEGISSSPGVLDWAGIAVFKNAYRELRQRGLPGTLLAAAYRHEGHWSQLIGREVLQTVPYTWWTKFNGGETKPTLTIENPVDDEIVAELRQRFPDFVRAHDANGMVPKEFITYGATMHTLRQFLDGYDALIAEVRGRMFAR